PRPHARARGRSGRRTREEPMARSRTLKQARPASARPAAEVVFLDRGIPHLEQLLAGLREGVEAIVLRPGASAPAQMAAALAGRRELQAIHVVAHGGPGEVRFGAGALSLETLGDHAKNLARIGAAPAEDRSLAPLS